MSSKPRIDHEVLEKIISSIESLEYGTVHITIHDSQITQIEKVEKHRFPLQKNIEHSKTVKKK
ncbi:YezD family protein [Bacillus sp. PS06]|uniref:YezD family protein n=1 Tax=Bacillus sp. PS06 TaxID=2764176 RepID=UPI00177C1914|nr:DUF2292 domain-containing protein [Bacillus sp. PS06]MBD8067648.1 YezD family protein [Bacillus sp. PS06]